jgi:hypothetical protein
MVTYSRPAPTPEYRRLLDILPAEDGRWFERETQNYAAPFKQRIVSGLLGLSPQIRAAVLGIMRAPTPAPRKIADLSKIAGLQNG